MFKRLFFLSGVIAFVMAALVMYFWYLPNQTADHSVEANPTVKQDTIAAVEDTLSME